MFWRQRAGAVCIWTENFTEEKMFQGFFKEAASLSRLLLIPVLIVAQAPMQAQSPINTPMPPNVGQLPGAIDPPAGSVCSFPEAANTWCRLANAPAGGLGTMLLLTDGRVMMVQQGSGGCGPAWSILTPPSNGDYGNGTWANTASMANQRLYFGSNVMQNGQVWVLGGEYSDSGTPGTCNDSGINNAITAKGEVYDPVANTWTALTAYPDSSSCDGWRTSNNGTSGTACFGDDPSQLLPNGKILAGDIFTNTPHIWTGPAPGSWAAAGSKVYNDPSDEEAWAKLPNGNIATYDLFQSIGTSCTTACFAEEYNPTTNTWSNISPGFNGNTGTLPLLSSVALGYEMGPLMRLQDGRLFQIGANQHNALYNPTTQVWSAGPNTIGSINGNGCGSNCAFGADDAPAAELPTGHVIYAADAGPTKGIFHAPTCLFDFNPTTNTTSVMSPAPPDLADCSGAATNGIAAYPSRMLMLPTGQMLFHDGGQGGNFLYLYTPTSTAAAPPYRPIVQGVSGSRPTLTLTGLQLNGQSAGSAYGDDVNTDENYPIVRLVTPSGTTTYYCKTTNWSSVAVGSVGSETVNFTVPIAVPAGSYSLIVTGAGIQSIPIAITIPSAGT
jgi:hypothetical protein